MASQSFWKRHWLAVEMAGCYSAFGTLVLLARPLKPVIGELADILQMAGYFWPYPVVLALQTWPVFEESLWPLIMLGGLGLVIAFAAFLRSSFHALAQPTWWARVSAVVLWYVPLFLSQAVLLLVMWSLGYPVGE
jgi:hypothetical protein